jgi:ubiquitin-protein ligase
MQKSIKKFIEEINQVSVYFHNIRTCFKQDSSDIDMYYFLIMPSDGYLSNLPISGRIIRSHDYPITPPIIHIFNKTGKTNVDIYIRNSGLLKSSLGYTKRSSICFDILTDWKPDYTLSLLFGSLIIEFSSYNSEQDTCKFISSMKKLDFVRTEAFEKYSYWKEYLPEIPILPKIYPSEIPSSQMIFTKYKAIPLALQEYDYCRTGLGLLNDSLISLSNLNVGCNYFNGPFILNDIQPKTFKFKLNLPSYIVFSVILTTNPCDLVGKNKGTVLFRNGITGTAAIKKYDTPIEWFYHGKPLNNNTIQVTLTKNQFTMVYFQDGKPIVLGDTSIVNFDDDDRAKKYYLVLYTKNTETPIENIKIPILETNGNGYIVSTD